MAQTQFRSDDTVGWWLKYGDGSDGAYSSSGNATDAPVDASCSGTSGTTSLSATNASFANGKPILIHQTRGTGVGAWELNQISSYSTGTITTVSPLKNTYTDSGASQAQVIQLKQYSSFTQNSGHTLTAKAWNGNVGGIIAFLCNGTTTITGSLTTAGKGFRGGVGASGATGTFLGTGGEGTTGYTGTGQAAQNTTGGGSGKQGAGASGNGGGGGGGHSATGTNGLGASSSDWGLGGGTDGGASLVDLVFGGGGGAGGGGSAGAGPNGGASGGSILIITKSITITGAISCNGAVGGTVHLDGSYDMGGGGGSGGASLIKAQTATLGTNKISASGGAGGGSNPGDAGGWGGGAGSVGRIHLDYFLSYTGTTTPTINVTQDYSLRTSVSSGIII